MDLFTGAITGTVTLVNAGLAIFTPDTFLGGAVTISLVGALLMAFAAGVMSLASRRRGRR